MAFEGPRQGVGIAGTMRLWVRYLGETTAQDGTARHGFSYMLTDVGAPDAAPRGGELSLGAVGTVTAVTAVRRLAADLLANATQKQSSERPAWLMETVRANQGELIGVATGARRSHESTAAPTQYVSVVFQEGSDAEEALAVLERDGPQAAIGYLAQWDFGDETELAARIYGHVYPEPPAGRDDRTHVSGHYALSWNLALGHIGLARRVRTPAPADSSPAPDETASGRRKPARSPGAPALRRRRGPDRSGPGL